MKPSSILSLVVTTLTCAAATVIVLSQFYGLLPPVPSTPVLIMLTLAGINSAAAWYIKQQISNNRIGFDRIQLEPTLVANFLLIGKASTWTGAIFGGVYLGFCAYILPKTAELMAASQDFPYVVAAAISGGLLTAAGLWLERSCQTPPPQEGEAA
ncbi:DUF3180 domain-containing protein [Corynebacterium sp. HS2168-gen11]|uniref:DUF3180 domain-containing protein n=1 Tax=Corynebacterium sp. HS2168-gen11 TaxID=2974027 RepID=UPI00216B3E43|nr:DUF3180 domain-containing protein [Corynebacterium sp. HS2168-gen11]MCS4536107.1 DUF3180 domain-containing protein [Corynebacterium sp. HS2168-gen11]